jgi:hypothetical protein
MSMRTWCSSVRRTRAGRRSTRRISHPCTRPSTPPSPASSRSTPDRSTTCCAPRCDDSPPAERPEPASTEPLSVRPGDPPVIEHDRLGNAVGGVRSPQVDVPIAALSGVGQPIGSPCTRFGSTIAFDDATLAALYPDHRSYVAAVRRAAKRAVQRGVLLAPDAAGIRRAAAASDVGR